jgi:hypothetical protein
MSSGAGIPPQCWACGTQGVTNTINKFNDLAQDAQCQLLGSESTVQAQRGDGMLK